MSDFYDYPKPIIIKDHPSEAYCSDVCPNLMSSIHDGGYCTRYKKRLRDYDINAHTVVFKRTKSCLGNRQKEKFYGA